MAAAITRIFRDPEIRRIMAEEGRKRAEKFDIKIAIDSLEALYKKGGDWE